MLYRTDLKDWYNLPCVFRTIEDAEAYAEEMGADVWAYEPLHLGADLEALVLRIAEETPDMDMIGESMEVLDSVVSAVLNGGEELQGLIDWLLENEFEELAEELKQEAK